MNKTQKLLIFIVLTFLLFTFPLYVTNQYFLTVSIFIYIYCVLTLGYRMIMKVGEVSFAHAAFMGIGAYTSALLTMRLEMSFWISWIIACALTALVAFILGSLAVRTKGVHFFLVTLAMGETVRLIGINWNAPLLGGPNGIFGIPAPTAITFGSFTIDFESRIALYFLSLFTLLVVVLIALCLDRSRVGRMWDSIGQDDRLAAAIGINVYGHKLASFVLSSTIAGLAGVIFAHFMTYISPYDFTFFFAMQLIIYVIFGGFCYDIRSINWSVCISYYFRGTQKSRILRSYILWFYISYCPKVFSPRDSELCKSIYPKS